MNFKGFYSPPSRAIPVPVEFFESLLAVLEDIDEIKLILYLLWHSDSRDDLLIYWRENELETEAELLEFFKTEPNKALKNALRKMVDKQVLLMRELDHGGESVVLYLLNTPRGRAAYESEKMTLAADGGLISSGRAPRPNIFRLYEANIGPLSPMIADSLRDAEKEFPLEWIEAAMHLAVEVNKRSWRYIEAILQRWQQEGGPGERRNRQSSEENIRRYRDDKNADFFDN